MAKAIFITGGGSGIGRATAQRFAREGWFVGLADVNAAGLAETAALLPDGRSSSHVMDVRDRATWASALADFAKDSGGRLDVLFNNAGIGLGGQFADLAPDEAERMIAINFTGVVNGIYAALPLLEATRGSAILNTASAAAIFGSPGLAVYSATKFAVRGLTEALDLEFAGRGVNAGGIRVRSLMPSFIDTPLLDVTVSGTNSTSRERVREAGFEFTPVEAVADAAWAAVHGRKIHTIIGKTAKKLHFAARWAPWLLNRQRKTIQQAAGLTEAPS